MKIIALTVTDENGVLHTWEGVEGHVRVRSTLHQTGKNATAYQRAVDAHLLLPAEPQVRA
jgi:CRISPR/Cas system-associated endonuclease Cas3-HD